MTMRALIVVPGQPESARLERVPEPDVRDGSVLVGTLAVSVCSTYVEIVRGGYIAIAGHDLARGEYRSTRTGPR